MHVNHPGVLLKMQIPGSEVLGWGPDFAFKELPGDANVVPGITM